MTRPDKPAAVARLFAAIAPRYDLMNRLMTAGMDLAWRRRAADLVGALPAGAPILDVGTGTADLALALARRRPEACVVGVDPSPEMLALGRRKVARAGLAARIALVRGDGLSLPCSSGAYAAVVSAFTLRNVADLPCALGEMRRAVVPGGVVLCLELSQPRSPGFRPLFRLYFSRLVPILGAVVARQRAAYTYLPQSVDAFLSPEGLAQAMTDAGLAVERVERLALGAAAIHVARRVSCAGRAGDRKVRRCAGGILLNGRRILLGKRTSSQRFYPDVWDIIGGHCEAGEAPEETLIREMGEEIDVVPRVFRKSAVLPEPAPDLYGEAEYHVFVVTGWTGLPVALGDEHAELRWFGLEEAMALDLAHPAYRSIFAALSDDLSQPLNVASEGD